MSAVDGYSLAELAAAYGLELRGDGAIRIVGVCSLAPGLPDRLGFCADRKLLPQLAGTRAAAVILGKREASGYTGNALVAVDAALAFAAIAKLFDRSREFTPGIHAMASVDPSASVGAGCGVGPGAVIEAGAEIGAGSYIGPNCVIRRNAVVGANSRFEANVYLGPDCRVGARALVLPGAVIGGRGFGLARAKTGWVEVPQLGRVLVGDDVEIGACTTIDRGALDDTVLEDGVKLDNHVQIAHNCRIGARTAMACYAGVAGSSQVGSDCMIGGAAVIGGHLKVCSGTLVLGRAMVTKSITEPGTYGSGLPAQPAREWRRTIGRIRRLPRLESRVEELEKALKIAPPSGEESGEQDDF
jgi:UDP-3-O-[3-hydroxymyristoyl] glucosamine N-acyltransferase